MSPAVSIVRRRRVRLSPFRFRCCPHLSDMVLLLSLDCRPATACHPGYVTQGVLRRRDAQVTGMLNVKSSPEAGPYGKGKEGCYGRWLRKEQHPPASPPSMAEGQGKKGKPLGKNRGSLQGNEATLNGRKEAARQIGQKRQTTDSYFIGIWRPNMARKLPGTGLPLGSWKGDCAARI
jgi:hypothetical protein